MAQRLKRNFFLRSTIKVAQDLLGKFIVRKIGRKKLSGMITETEAYIGEEDLASHASRGKTKRTAPMYLQGGFSYVYLIYGMYYNFNIVTERKDFPAAVLIRSVEPKEGIKEMRRRRENRKTKKPSTHYSLLATLYKLTTGPGKFCQAYGITKKENALDLTKNKNLYLEDRGIKIKPCKIKKTTRIGVEYAEKWKEKKWRFYIKDSKFISKK